MKKIKKEKISLSNVFGALDAVGLLLFTSWTNKATKNDLITIRNFIDKLITKRKDKFNNKLGRKKNNGCYNLYSNNILVGEVEEKVTKKANIYVEFKKGIHVSTEELKNMVYEIEKKLK